MNPLTAPAVLNEGLADFLDADIPFLLVVAMFFLVFAIGHATGYTHGHLNGVDRERQRLLDEALQSLADTPTPQLTEDEVTAWGQRFSEALRAQLPVTLATLDDRPHPWLRPDKRMVCGKPAQTNLGAVRCLAAPGHLGQC